MSDETKHINYFDRETIKIAKERRNLLIAHGDIHGRACRACYMAGEIVMWSDLGGDLANAAPDLLVALTDLLYHVEDIPGNEYFDEKIFSNARKAINKATS